MTNHALPTLSSQRASMNNQTSRTLSLWDRARQSLPLETHKLIDFQHLGQVDILKDVLQLAEAKREECLRKRWKIKRSNGEVIVLRDVFEKIVSFAVRFREVGDVAIQYDPGHAALPWAGVRLLLQVVINETSTFAALLEGLEHVTNCISRYAIVEAIFLLEPSIPSENLANSMVEAYASILTFLGKSIAYLDTSTSKRILKNSLGSTERAITELIADINKRQLKVEQDALLVQGFRQLGLVDITTSLTEQVKQSTLTLQSYNFSVYQSLINDNLQMRTDIDRLTRLALDLTIPVHRISQSLQDLDDIKSEAQKLSLLRWVSTIPFDQHHNNIRKSRISGTGQWLFDKQKFKNWRTSSCSSVLWLHGIPGSGKTVLASSLIDYICNEMQIDKCFSPPLAFFYCSRNPAEPERAVPLEVLASIARQLAGDRQCRTIRKPLRQAYEAIKSSGFEARKMDLDEIVNIIVELNKSCSSVIVIDALDECDPATRHEIFESLDEILIRSENVVKVFLTSRSDHDIECRLNNVPNIYIKAEDNEADISRFIDFEVSRAIDRKRILCGQVSATLQEKISKTLTHGAQGMFRWVSLQVQNLCNPQRIKIEADVAHELGHMPKTLSDMYDVIYQQLLQSGRTSAILATRALQWVMAARRQLSPLELAAGIVAGYKGTEVTLEVEHVIRITGNLLVIDEFLNTVRFAHVSVREYLELRREFTQAECNMQLGLSCLNFYQNYQSHIKNQPKVVPGTAGIRDYAKSYWPFHASDVKDSSQRKVLAKTLNELILDSPHTSPTFAAWRRDVNSAQDDDDDDDDDDHSDVKDRLMACITPIHTCALFGFWEILENYGQQAVERYNFAFQDRIEASPYHGQNGLHLAIFHGCYKTVNLLLDFGANANEVTTTNLTPMYLAVVRNYDHLISSLVGHGADLNQAVPLAKGSQVPFGARYVNFDSAERSLHPDSVTLNPTRMGHRSADGRITSSIDEEFETPMHHAASHGYLDIVLELAQHGADVNVTNNIGSTPLMKALEFDRHEIMEALLRRGVMIDKELVHGRTALHIASALGNVEAVRFLLDSGADPSRQDWLGFTASDLAYRYQHNEVVKILPLQSPDASANYIIDNGEDEPSLLLNDIKLYEHEAEGAVQEWDQLLQDISDPVVPALPKIPRKKPLPIRSTKESHSTNANA